jgi:hypothetical protein
MIDSQKWHPLLRRKWSNRGTKNSTVASSFLLESYIKAGYPNIVEDRIKWSNNYSYIKKPRSMFLHQKSRIEWSKVIRYLDYDLLEYDAV